MNNYDYISVLLHLPGNDGISKSPFITDSFNNARDFYVIQQNGYLYEDVSEKSLMFRRRYLPDFNGSVRIQEINEPKKVYVADFINGKVSKISRVEENFYDK